MDGLGRRRSLQIWVLALVFALVAAACGGGTEAGDQQGGGGQAAEEDHGPLRLMHAVWVGYGPMYLAQAKGFFEEEGVEVELIKQNDFKQQFTALAAGEIDGVLQVVDAAVSYYIPGLEYQMVAAFDDSLGGDGIGATTDIQSIADLKGKSVGYETGATAEFFFNVMLERSGLTDEDINHIDMLGSDAGTALLSGRVDAAVTYEPYLTEIRENEGTHVLSDTREAPGLITDILIVRQDVIDERPEDVQGVVNAYFRALDYMEQNLEESIPIMAEGVGGFLRDPADFEETLQFVQFFDEEGNAAYFSDPSNEGTQIMETLQNAIEIWGRIADLPELPPAEELVNPQFVLNS